MFSSMNPSKARRVPRYPAMAGLRLRGMALTASVLFLFGQPVLADVVEQGPKDAKPSGLLAGVARANITPAAGIPQQNWGSQTHVVAKGIDPAGMFLRALVLSDGRQKFALVDVDAISVAGLDDAIGRASALTGIPADHIRLGASHTHSAPSLSRDKGPVGADVSQYERMMESHRAVLADKLVGAIVEANGQLRPVHAYSRVGTGSINLNRRFRGQGDEMPPGVGLNPDGFTDRELVVIRIDDAQGNPYAVLVNFQCHGTVLAYENQYISADWIGAMRNTVEASLPGAACLYFQGAAGNQGPTEGFSGDLEVAHRLGSILGHEAAALALRIDTVRREPRFEGYTESTALQARQPYRVSGPRDARLIYTSKTLDLPRRTYTAADIERTARLAAAAQKKVEEVERTHGSAWDQYQARARHRRYAGLLERWQRPVDATPVKLEVAVLRIGETALVLTNGELFAEIGAAVKKASPFQATMFCGYGNRVGDGYMPVRSEYALGGYEVDNTPYGDGAAGKVVEEAVALLNSVQ
jgi:neutral ceramidase